MLIMLPLLALLFACQSEEYNDAPKPMPRMTVKATLPSPAATRAYITYDHTDQEVELLQWCSEGEDKDYIVLFNITQFADYHMKYSAPMMFIDPESINGLNANFIYNPDRDEEAADNERFEAIKKPGDLILAVLGGAAASNLDEIEGEENWLACFLGSTFYDQKIYADPRNDTISPLAHVNKMLRMYAFAKVGEDGKISDLNFKHMSSIFRVSLHNETGRPLFTGPTDLTFEYPTAPNDSCFIFGFSKFCVAGNDIDGYYLKEKFKAPEERHPLNPTPPDTVTYVTRKVTHKVNEKSQKAVLESGKSYELYSVVTPRLGNQSKGDKFTINLYTGVESGYGVYDDVEKYSITINDFNKVIEPGLRYWFNLVACKDDDGKPTLMFYSEWKALHPDEEKE